MRTQISKPVVSIVMSIVLLASAGELNAQNLSRRGNGIAQQLLGRFTSQQRSYQQPTYQQPNYQQQVYQQPTYHQPSCPNSRYRPTYQQPIYGQPVYPQPIVSQPQPVKPQPVKPATPAELARKYTSEAASLFKSGQYAKASEKLDEVVRLAPKDTNAYQFRALASFATSKFDSSAADAYDAMALGNTWTREVLKSVYGKDLTRYDRQLQALKQHVQTKPSMSAHFLLAYHHLLNEQWAEGKTQLEQVVQIQKDEPLSTKLLAAVNAKMAKDANGVAVNR